MCHTGNELQKYVSNFYSRLLGYTMLVLSFSIDARKKQIEFNYFQFWEELYTLWRE